MSAYYVGLVLGGRIGYLMIVRTGHVRAFAAAAAACSVMVLTQTLIDEKWVWLWLRAIAGGSMAVQFIVLESWLNEQIENENRGRVLSVYLVMSGLGIALGQMAIMLYPALDLRPLTLVAICHVVGLIPIVWTVRLHPGPQLPAPLDFGYFFKRAPAALLTMFLAGNITSAFYAFGPGVCRGLVPEYRRSCQLYDDCRHGRAIGSMAYRLVVRPNQSQKAHFRERSRTQFGQGFAMGLVRRALLVAVVVSSDQRTRSIHALCHRRLICQ